MEESAYNSLMLGVYIFIFVTAISLTVFLFSSTVEYADKAYEYGKLTAADSIVETTSAPKYNVVTGAELLSYYYNYKDPDKYGTPEAQKFDFENIDNIQVNKLYTLIYKKAYTDQNPVIEVKVVGSEQDVDPGPPLVVNMQPTAPTIKTYPSTATKIVPGTTVQIEAESTVTYSISTNYIKNYIWRIDYSPEDGRADFTTTTMGSIGKLKSTEFGDKLEFREGINTVYVTSEDSFGNRSTTVHKDIEVGYNDPIVNSIVEATNKVINFGNVTVESSSGVALKFVANAISANAPSGYISKYDWYSNNVLIQSNASNILDKNFTSGTYTLKVIAHDSIAGISAPKTFTFTVGNIPAPTITCSNSEIITANTIGIDTSTANLTFNANLESKYGIVKYLWNIDGTSYQTNVPNGSNLNYGVGSHTISVYGVNSQGITSETSSLTFTITQNYIPFEKTYVVNNYYYTETLPAGKYVFELWGAQGGNSEGGYGGYSTGQLNLTTSTTFYIYVGSSAGYNGGGSSRLSYSNGGGATDIRLTSGTWYNSSSLISRIMVAGGGAGNGGYGIYSAGATAGGLTGYTGVDRFGSPGTGGTQTSGGLAGRLYSYGATNGAFGIGGNAETASNTSAGAGGGGYYGGGGASSDYPNYDDLDDSGGGGGSSFISGYTGCDAVNSSGIHTGQVNHYSGLTFVNSSMVSGTNMGNGKAKITRVL